MCVGTVGGRIVSEGRKIISEFKWAQEQAMTFSKDFKKKFFFFFASENKPILCAFLFYHFDSISEQQMYLHLYCLQEDGDRIWCWIGPNIPHGILHSSCKTVTFHEAICILFSPWTVFLQVKAVYSKRGKPRISFETIMCPMKGSYVSDIVGFRLFLPFSNEGAL